MPASTSLRRSLRSVTVALGLFVAAPAVAPAHAATDAIRVLASDAGGVTLRLDLPPLSVIPAEAGRSRIGIAGLARTDAAGRPMLPYASTLVALPPGARAVARVMGGDAEEVREGVRLEVSGEPTFVRNADGTDFTPTRTPRAPIVDGRWPVREVQVGEPFTLRRQRVATLVLTPVAYDEGAARLFVRRSLTVRVDFVGATGAAAAPPTAVTPDRHWDAVLEKAIVNYPAARGWRATPRPAVRRGATLGRSLFEREPQSAGAAATAAFDEDNPEVRVQVDTTAFYSLTFSQLSAKGFPAGIPIAQVSVHRHEYAPGAQPPYVTIELPIGVDDLNANGVFDGSDRIYVYVQTWAERSGVNVHQRRWGDAEVVFVTYLTGGSGLRFAQRPSWRATSGLVPPTSYPWSEHHERNFEFFTAPDDTIYDPFLWTINLPYYRTAGADSFGFDANHLDAGRPATIAIRFMGRDYASHLVRADIRNSPSAAFTPIGDSLVFNAKGTATLSATLPGTVLGEGRNNRIQIYGRQLTFPPDPVLNPAAAASVDYFDVTYWRAYRGLRGLLDCNSGDAAGEFQIHATGMLNSRIRAFDVTNPAYPVQLAIAPADTATQIQTAGTEFTFDFQDSVATGAPRRYVVFSIARSIPAARITSVTRYHLTDRTSGDQLIVTPEALVASVQPLVALRQSEGLSVAVAPVEALYDEFNGGRKSAHAIKRYARYAYDNWNARFLLLVGDGSQDPQNFSKTAGPDLVPAFDIIGPVGVPLGRELVPSDPWFGCLDNDCDLDDAIPDVPDLFVGRLAVQNAQQSADVVAKLVAYDAVSPADTWRRRLVLLADDAYSGGTYFGDPGASNYCYKIDELVFQEISDTVASVVRNQAGLRATDIRPFYLSVYLAGEPVNPNGCRPDLDATRDRTQAGVTPQLLTELSRGCLWWNYQGHANQYVLTHENLYLNASGIDDKDYLQNDGKPFLFSAFSCHANAFARTDEGAPANGPSIGEDIVNLPVRGAIGSWASTGYEILPNGGGQHINTALAVSMFADPPSDPYLDYRGARVVVGESIALALLRYVSPLSFYERGIGLTYNLLGDPATRLSIGSAQTLVRANGQDVTSGQAIRLHTAGDTLHLEADIVSNVQIETLRLERSDGAGTDTIPSGDYVVTPAFPDTGAGSVNGGRRFQLDYHTTLVANTFKYTIRTVDRYGVPGAFDAVFQLLAQLRLGGTPIASNDPVPPNADLSIQLLSPRPLVPASDLTLAINGVVQAFTAAPASGDTSGREWILSWTHPLYGIDQYTAHVEVAGGGSADLQFRVIVGETTLSLQDALNFPNPFDDDLGTHFSFFLLSDSPSDVMVRVFTSSGRLVYERTERSLSPGYHQLAWDGRDAEGDKLANGVYLCRILATNGSAHAERTLRLVKLRKPRRSAEDTAVTGP